MELLQQLSAEVDRVEGLLADRASLQPGTYFDVLLWYIVDQIVTEAKACLDNTHYTELRPHYRKLIAELSFYK